MNAQHGNSQKLSYLNLANDSTKGEDHMGDIGRSKFLTHILKQMDSQSGMGHRSGQPKPIASMPTNFDLKATRIDWVGGELVYCDEIPIRVRPAVPLDIDSDGEQLFVNYRFEVSALSKDFNRQASQYEIIIASHPYSKNWVGSAPFKRSINKRSSDSERREAVLDKINRADSPTQELEGLDFDPFQGASPRVSANIHHFENKADNGFEARSTPNKKVILARYNPVKKFTPDSVRYGRCIEQWVFGAVKNKSKALSWLLETPMTEYLRSLTNSGDLLNELCRGRQYPQARDLQEETIELGNDILEAAAWKALAGPLTEDVPHWVGNGNQPGKPVTTMLQHQYLYMMHAVNVRFNRQPLFKNESTSDSEEINIASLNAQELQQQLYESLRMQDEAMQLKRDEVEPEEILELLLDRACDAVRLPDQIAFCTDYVATRFWFETREEMQLDKALAIIEQFNTDYRPVFNAFVSDRIRKHFL